MLCRESGDDVYRAPQLLLQLRNQFQFGGERKLLWCFYEQVNVAPKSIFPDTRAKHDSPGSAAGELSNPLNNGFFLVGRQSYGLTRMLAGSFKN